MSFRRRLDQREFMAGAAFVLFGISFSLVAVNYPLGTAMRMGPGYFPALLGLLLSCIGVLIGISALRRRPITDRSASNAPFNWSCLRPALLISASVLLFAAAIESAGLALATFGVVAVSGLANREARWPAVSASGIALSVMSVGIFAYGLRLPFRVAPF
ncbi:tripartite tricarboxylate transporter TctB family protein [Rhodopseudomonas sp. HC1]|uniref:tripartite tricarboxylate transporter TctB family protein n=1 Tax=Rhodopseudomonas infernalis TaxID=2897386 RepID=UPI001EE98456|nr:tripartite tricarboxylate transporter TctB family protein [Rhodopseudomonas infernalis]MCG6203424.1 tripartite tricarboxylate transporter TctB family protein [Rhodopseudomonas infernalis]